MKFLEIILQIFYLCLLISIIVYLFLETKNHFVSWKKNIQLFGYNGVLTLIWNRAKIWSYQPLLKMISRFPPIHSISCILFSQYLYESWTKDKLDLYFCFLILIAPHTILLLSFFYIPAAVTLFTASLQGDNLAYKITVSTQTKVFTLIDNYRMFEIYDLRSRSNKWHRAVRMLINVSPILVIDCRSISPFLLKEIAFIVEMEKTFKTFFVIEYNSANPIVKSIMLQSEKLKNLGGIFLSEKELLTVIPRITQSRETLPKPFINGNGCIRELVDFFEDLKISPVTFPRKRPFFNLLWHLIVVSIIMFLGAGVGKFLGNEKTGVDLAALTVFIYLFFLAFLVTRNNDHWTNI